MPANAKHTGDRAMLHSESDSDSELSASSMLTANGVRTSSASIPTDASVCGASAFRRLTTGVELHSWVSNTTRVSIQMAGSCINALREACFPRRLATQTWTTQRVQRSHARGKQVQPEQSSRIRRC
eukprot:463322-Prymnesium_polylepis.1